MRCEQSELSHRGRETGVNYYVYVLLSLKDKDFYVGRAQNVEEREKQHTSGKVKSTKNRRPVKVVDYEFCRNAKDAAIRELYLKSSWGKRYIKNRLKNDLKENYKDQDE